MHKWVMIWGFQEKFRSCIKESNKSSKSENIISEVKKVIVGSEIRLDNEKERVSEPEDKSIEGIQYFSNQLIETQREKN